MKMTKFKNRSSTGKSKRKSSDHTVSSAKKRKTGNNFTDSSVFTDLVIKCGITLKDGSTNNEINIDQAVFQKKLVVALKAHENYPEAINDLLEGLQTYISEPSRFHKMLMPTLTSSGCDSSRASIQDSVIRILMGIDMLQNQVMNLLLEKLPEFIGESDHIVENGDTMFVPHLLLSQFRWLDRIKDCKQLTNKLIEMIGVTSLDVQREIISCLPEVVEDSEHALVANALRDILLQGNQLTIVVLDALSNLNLTLELLSEVRGSVLQTLKSVELDDLPVVIKFLLQTVTTQDALEVVSEIRSSLNFKTSTPSGKASSKNASKQLTKSSDKGCETLTLDAIKSGIHFQKSVAEAFVKAIDSVKVPGEQKVLDLFVLLILHSTNRRKSVESLFRNKIRSGCFSEVFLQTCFSSHSQVLREYITCILTLSEVLLRSPEPNISYFACSMYKHCFITFDAFCKQEIVGNLVTHIGSGFDGEIDASLHILVDLVENNLQAMVPFAIFVKGVLDYLDNLSVSQIRKLYSMLSRLAFYNAEEGGLIQDDLHIIIRKQLSSSSPKYKRMGVIGAIMIVKSIAVISNGSDSELDEELFNQVVCLLQLVKKGSSNMPEATALFMDELSSVINKRRLALNIENWISENVTSDFQDDFVADIEEGKLEKQWMVPMDLIFGLNEEEESAIAIDLLPLIFKNTGNKITQDKQRIPKPICLSSHFRLVQICEYRQQDGNLEGIDALLGCPIYTVQRDVVDKISSLSRKEKEVICTNLFYEINWFIEMVNGFSTQTDVEMIGKVICRLKNITDSKILLEKCLAETPEFKPPLANFDLEEKPAGLSFGASTSKENKKTGKKSSKKNTGDKVNLNDSDDASRDSTQNQKANESFGTQVGDKDGKVKPTANFSNYRCYLRELDIHVFTILTNSVISASDSEPNAKSTEVLKLKPPQISYLLEDLVFKLSHSLMASATKRRTFLKTKGDKNVGFSHLDQLSSLEIVTKITHLLPSLCEHLERASAFFQKQISDNDGIVDGPSSPETQYMAAIFKNLLQIFLSIFTWNGFLINSNRDLLREGLGVLVGRIRNTADTPTSFNELIRSSFEYLRNLSSTIFNLESGVILIKLLISVGEKDDGSQLYQNIASLSGELLKREWLTADGEREKGQKYNELLHNVIRTYIIYSEEPLTAIESLTTKGIPELIQADKNGCSNTFPSLTRNSFPVYFRIIYSQLVDCIKSIKPYKQSDIKQVKVDKLIQWNMAVRIHHVLVNLLKVFGGRGVLGTVLKSGRQFVEVFYRQAMPLLDSMFRCHREDVQSLLKAFQLSTRALHHLCGHSKIIKDLSLTNQVPMMKKALEAFVYRVMLMLTVNKCPEAFWMGNLKNRDLQGDEILSQVSQVSTASGGGGGGDGGGTDDEEELVDDDDDDESEVEMDETDVTKTRQEGEESEDASCSEIF